MSIKNTYDGALVHPDVKAEIDAIHQEIAALKKTVIHQAEVINANKDVLFDLLETLKKHSQDIESL